LPESWRTALAFLLACACLVQAPLAASAPEEHYGKVGEVQCTVIYNWPKLINMGYFPVTLRLSNGGREAVVVAIAAEQSWAAEDEVRRRVALAAGETLELELLLRARHRTGSQYRVTFEVGGDDVDVAGAGPQQYPRSGSERIILHTSARPLEAGKAEAWSETWESQRSAPVGHRSGGTLVSACTFDQLSRTWQAYTCLDTVVVDLRDGQLEPEVLGALLAWCRSGGKLVLGGVASRELRELPGLQWILEERFLTQPEDANFEELGLAAYRCAFGVLVVQAELLPEASLMDVAAPRGAVALRADESSFATTWTRGSFGRRSRLMAALGELGNFANLPLRSLMLLLVAFAFLMGPVNFLWVKRTKKPMLLLASVPAIALVSSVTLILYGVFSQGLDVKTIARTWSILDQRNGSSTTAEVRRVFAGSAPGEGLRPEAGTLIFPENSFWQGGFQQGKHFTLDLDDGKLYGGDYFPIRRPFGQLVLSDRSARLRLEACARDGAVEVTNALGEELQELLLCAPDGTYHYLDGSLGAGRSTRLIEGGFSAKRVQWQADLERLWGESEERLLPGTYVAQLRSAPLRDDCGISVNEVDGRHVLLGILDLSAEAWQ
jgi:hypothetical protein